ncbi:MAG: four helix bundle protein [Oscillospiraceae bacterium]|nr:four helix bundle protein [Oscillospiraceae bacterium]
MNSAAVQEKSFSFAVRIVNLCRYLQAERKEYVLSKQLLRSGTSIGANVAESQQAQSRSDFINKLNIALKEAYETNYWLRLMFETKYLNTQEFESIIADCKELEKLLIAIIKTTKE